MGRACGLQYRASIGGAQLTQRRKPLLPAGALAPVSSGWMEHRDGTRVSVNLTLAADGKTLRGWMQVIERTGQRYKRPVFEGEDLADATQAINTRVELMGLRNFHGVDGPVGTVQLSEAMRVLGLDVDTPAPAKTLSLDDALEHAERAPLRSDVLAGLRPAGHRVDREPLIDVRA